jgi:hypothetical protein
MKPARAVCEKCKKTETPWQCTHMGDTLPPWMSGEKHAKIRNFMPTDLLGRETMGITTTLAQKAFTGKVCADVSLYFHTAALSTLEGVRTNPLIRAAHAQVIRAFEEREHIRFDDLAPTEFTFTAVDPSGGGASEYAVVTIVLISGMLVVCITPSSFQQNAKKPSMFSRSRQKLPWPLQRKCMRSLLNQSRKPFMATCPHPTNQICKTLSLSVEDSRGGGRTMLSGRR